MFIHSPNRQGAVLAIRNMSKRRPFSKFDSIFQSAFSSPGRPYYRFERLNEESSFFQLGGLDYFEMTFILYHYADLFVRYTVRRPPLPNSVLAFRPPNEFSSDHDPGCPIAIRGYVRNVWVLKKEIFPRHFLSRTK